MQTKQGSPEDQRRYRDVVARVAAYEQVPRAEITNAAEAVGKTHDDVLEDASKTQRRAKAAQ